MAQLPKEKALELFKKYYCLTNNSNSKLKVIEYETAKQCALIAVDEILQLDIRARNSIEPYEYWEQVKNEINNL